MAPSRKLIHPLLGWGLLSCGLYALLFCFSEDCIRLAEATRGGDKAMFGAPIVIALVFSLVHGNFTAHFFDALGLRPRR